MDEFNKQPGQASYGSAAKPLTRSTVRVNQLPVLWTRQLPQCIRAVTNCLAWPTRLLTSFKPRPIMFAGPT